MSTRTSNWSAAERVAAGVALAALALALVMPAPAEASLFGKKKPKTDFSTTFPPAQPQPAPPPVMAPPPPAQANGAIFQASAGYAPLYEGWRAKRVGDPLTIVLVERTLASKTSRSQLDSQGNAAIIPPAAGPLALAPEAARAGGNRLFRGQGQADQSNSLSGELSVTVAAVYPNGTMLVQGTKRVVLNRGDEFMQIRGLVRMADVDIDNRVASTRVADAQIEYTGRGDVARAARQGWLSRFFSVVSPF
ncbi:flagellar basal body L-ring protein FlgH [Sphingomonas sp.]|uniref:flagellar basal body L-ring protein FlgH n=1 Tax=Sphingomonas sp. TaxID=28214 RepID=UPI001D644488|nr:flagellar basal body L-ring protein FlgH [Sphingomonas sp.]MBX9795377.1 flagellar basal body L-ring protein FlgH [Sphingomonas sp.]